MKLQRVQLKNFKRFKDLTIENIPLNAKLVLLVGSNGSGKSSVFDAFNFVKSRIQGQGYDSNFEPQYYKHNKSEDFGVTLEFYDYEKIEISGFINPTTKDSDQNIFYGRTSFRQLPRLTRTVIGQQNFDIEKDSDRPKLFIEKDERFENDVEKITGTILKEFFRTDKSKEQIRENYIEPINTALENIFGENTGTKLTLIEIIPPLEGNVAQINFRKGNSEIHYNVLSAGEKEVLNLLINLLSRKDTYQNTIFFLDEIDIHLESKTQFRLLEEITKNWIPENCQLWTASHSLGFIEHAQETENAVIIDFDDLDFDIPQILSPTDKTNYEIFEIAVSKEFIEKIFQGRQVFFAENTDVPLYNDLFIENTIFFIAIDKADVFHKSKNLKTFGLIDRDFLTDDEVVLVQETYPNLKILPYYSIENLLFHPENLAEYFAEKGKDFDLEDYKNKLTTEKNNKRDDIVFGIFNARMGYPFFKENDYTKQLKSFRDNGRAINDLLRSDDFETFYKVFPAKDFGKSVIPKDNASNKDLAKTKWFRSQVESLLKD